ncbi:FAD/NAD(P)-binding domain-containing protein [Mollisia scopiformis]|uniref:FAD/NAD(P)-binding domain-containing protein n=1 Tax=Mollisia scopiformis TaxID=149040 RepID=A0A194X9T4_MOLSC|nr:FAD/NAD(P)-binding domain-containing protein [Mollisia scopiformis]KUJ16928.1 FAD/NAD(P)-binding domain-containing protein [Mollisia scopiformis]
MSPTLEVNLDTEIHRSVSSKVNSTQKTENLIQEPIHPTRSLQFLRNSSSEYNNDACSLQAKVRLRIIVVGAGLGGLACAIALARRGHTITVLEQANQLGEVGAGIQIPPNSSRLLHSWGLQPFLKSAVVEPDGMTFRRWLDGKVIGYTKLVPQFRENFHAPYYVIHRAHFHDALYRKALELGVQVKVASRVEKYDIEAPSVELASGDILKADLIVAADGVKSVARKFVLGGNDIPPERTGFAAYRATVDAAKIKDDPEISWLLEKPSVNIWIGEDRHVMTYTIAAGESFNMVLSHVDTSDPATWKPEKALKDMQDYFTGWDPRLTKIIAMIDKTIKWPLLSGKSLPRWVTPSSKVLIMGDAAHAMVPYMSQGAAMAVEDGAALATVLSLIDTAEDIPAALMAFETVRMKRSGQMQAASLLNGKLWHFPDGPEQILRDESMKAEVEGRSFSWSANQWSDPVTQWWAYGYDAEKEVEDEWERCQKHVRPAVKL